MLKNSKLLKGISLVFACVLVLFCAVLLTDYVQASGKTVIYYVSDNGDNTTGKDEATAFTTLDAALKKANEAKLPTGSSLKIIVVDRITVKTQAVDPTLVLDASGYRLPVTITSQEGSSVDDRADLYLAYESSTASSSSQTATFKNDLTLKDINVTIKIQDYAVGFSTSSSAKKYCQKSIYFVGNITVFDGCSIAPERKGSDVPDIIGYVDYSTNNAIYSFDKFVTFKNGNYTGIAWFFSNFRVPNFTLTIDIEDATFSSFDLLRNSSTATTQDITKYTLNLRKGAKITNMINVANTGHYTIPEGLTINYYEGCDVKSVAARNGSNGTSAGIDANITHNIYGGNIGTFAATPYGTVTGDVTVNMYGGTVGTYYGAGSYSESKNNIKGAITNNIYAGTIKSFIGGGAGTGTYTTITNNIEKDAQLFGFSGGPSGESTVDTIVNNINGASLYGSYRGGPGSGTYGTIINNFHDATFCVKAAGASDTPYLRAGAGNAVGDYIINNVTGDCVFSTRVYFGNFDSLADTKISVTNNISGNPVFKNIYDGGSQRGAISGEIINNISGGTFNSTYYGGIRGNSGDSCFAGAVTNNISGGEFKSVFYGGNNGSDKDSPVLGDIKNNISGGTFKNTFYAGNHILAKGEVLGSILNNISGGTFEGVVCAGNRNNNVYGKIHSSITGGSFATTFVAGIYEIGNVYGGVITDLCGGEFKGAIKGANNTSDYTVNFAELNIAPKADAEQLILSGTIAASDDFVTTLKSSADRAILIGSKTSIYADKFEGTAPQIMIQTGTWAVDQVYVELATAIDTSLIVPSSPQVSDQSGVFDGIYVKGADIPTTNPITPQPTLKASFLLEDKLGVRFWVPVSQIQTYIQEKGEWSYSVKFMDQEISAASYQSISQLPQSDIHSDGTEDCFTFVAGLGIPASQYDESITILMCDINPVTYTVYDLLESGIEYANAIGKAELETLLKSIHQYGVSADNYFDSAELTQVYSVGVEGTYTELPQRTKHLRGVNIEQLSLSLDEKVAMNYYVTTTLTPTFKVYNENTNKEMNAANISVQEVATDAEYKCYVVTLKLDASLMNNEYRLEVWSGDDLYITCNNSLALSCAYYVQNNVCADVANNILAYMESVQKYLAAGN